MNSTGPDIAPCNEIPRKRHPLFRALMIALLLIAFIAAGFSGFALGTKKVGSNWIELSAETVGTTPTPSMPNEEAMKLQRETVAAKQLLVLQKQQIESLQGQAERAQKEILDALS